MTIFRSLASTKKDLDYFVPLTQSKTSPTQHILDKADCDELNNSNVDTKAAEVTEVILLSKFQGKDSSQNETLSTIPNKVRPINRARFDESLSGFLQAGVVAAKLSDRPNLYEKLPRVRDKL